MIPSKSSLISSIVTVAVLSVSSPAKAFIAGSFIAPMPFFYFGIIADPYPSKIAVLSSGVVILFNYIGISWWGTILLAVSIGTAADIWRKAKTRVG